MKSNHIYRKILLNKEINKKMLAILIDPEKCYGRQFASLVATLKTSSPDFIFIGGSHAVKSVDNMIELLKDELESTIVLFPGDISQFSSKADVILYLSLISGRNPDYLIGQHVKSAKEIKESTIEVIPSGYILIEGGKVSCVEYISNTRPIPADKTEIIKSTAIAGELLGMQLIYLEAGSGAPHPVSANVITEVKSSVSIPVIVGGGIITIAAMNQAFDAGADLIVIGNAIEANQQKIIEFVNAVEFYNDSKKEPIIGREFSHPDIIPL